MPARLVTIPISHFCEKARWGLHRAGVPYVEQPHLQLVHIAAARRAGGGRSVPVFVADDGEVVADSTDILRWAERRLTPDQRLYPDGELGRRAAALEDAFDDGLGPDSRLWIYHATLPVVARLRPWAEVGLPGWERLVFRRAGPLVNIALSRALGHHRRVGGGGARERGAGVRRGRRSRRGWPALSPGRPLHRRRPHVRGPLGRDAPARRLRLASPAAGGDARSCRPDHPPPAGAPRRRVRRSSLSRGALGTARRCVTVAVRPPACCRGGRGPDRVAECRTWRSGRARKSARPGLRRRASPRRARRGSARCPAPGGRRRRR